MSGCNADGKPAVTQVSVLLKETDDNLFLQGLIMRNTDHHKAFAQRSDALVLFKGSSCYVSASWHTQPLPASTWNYVTVHARGTLSFKDDIFLEKLLAESTAYFEQDNPSATLFGHLPATYTAPLLKAIAAFEIEVTALEEVVKLSQNKDHPTQENIIARLSQGNEDARKIADMMLSQSDPNA